MMRSEEEIISLIQQTALKDDRIRAVILNGSRTNPKVKHDRYQDFDVVYIVTEISSFQKDSSWIDVFGDRLILQMPNTMQLDDTELQHHSEITYLMLFKDTNRIDLNLVHIHDKALVEDSLNKILLDKDNIFDKENQPNDSDYWIKEPTQKQFSDCCNEFWWVNTYVAKGLVRNEITYAKDMFENPVRSMFMKMIAWHVGVQTGFSVNLGKSQKFLQDNVSPILWDRILQTYPDAQRLNIWDSLKNMALLFDELAIKISEELGLDYNHQESKNISGYLYSLEKELK